VGRDARSNPGWALRHDRERPPVERAVSHRSVAPRSSRCAPRPRARCARTGWASRDHRARAARDLALAARATRSCDRRRCRRASAVPDAGAVSRAREADGLVPRRAELESTRRARCARRSCTHPQGSLEAQLPRARSRSRAGVRRFIVSHRVGAPRREGQARPRRLRSARSSSARAARARCERHQPLLRVALARRRPPRGRPRGEGDGLRLVADGDIARAAAVGEPPPGSVG